MSIALVMSHVCNHGKSIGGLASLVRVPVDVTPVLLGASDHHEVFRMHH